MAAKEHQFDISAKLDMQEMKNAVIQAQKEIDNRYDFKGITKEVDLNVGAKTLTLISSSDNKIDAMRDILISNMNKRGISINSLEELKKEDSTLAYPIILLTQFKSRIEWVELDPLSHVSDEELARIKPMVQNNASSYDVKRYTQLLAYNGKIQEAEQQLWILQHLYGQNYTVEDLLKPKAQAK